LRTRRVAVDAHGDVALVGGDARAEAAFSAPSDLSLLVEKRDGMTAGRAKRWLRVPSDYLWVPGI